MCDCLVETNKALHEQYPHHSISSTMPWKKGQISKAIILAERSQFAPKGTSSKPLTIIPNYCPFCGEEYKDQQPTPPEEQS